MMQSNRTWFVLAVVIGALGSVGTASARPEVVEVPVAFHVLNTNTTKTQCQSDGLAYTLRGSLVGPERKLRDTAHDAVTLYLHGSGDASSWHFTAVPGVDHITEMAREGHVSVFIHNLGYGTSDEANGNAICYGSFVDMAHQVVGKLRSGDYLTAGETAVPRFERVALAGHSGGSVAAELYTISYADVDAVVFAGWADSPPTMTGFYPAVAQFGAKCAQGGEPKRPGGPPGWAKVFTEPEQFDVLLYNTDAAVRDAFVGLYEADACGIAPDALQIIALNLALAGTVEIPALLVYGDHDPWSPGAFDLQRARYTGSDDVSLLVLPNTGHCMMVGRTAAGFRSVLSEWLKARGF